MLKDEEYEDDYENGPGNDDEYYDEHDNQNQHHQQHLQNQQQRSGGSGSSQYYQQQHQYGPQSSGSSLDQRFQHYPRQRRDLPNFNDLELKNRLACNRSRCAVIRCTTSQLETDKSAYIALRMRLVTQTLNLVCENT